MAAIEIFCVLGRHGAEYAELLRRNLLLLASGEHQLLWRCVTTGGFPRVPAGFQLAEHVENLGQGSRTHGHGLNAVMRAAQADYTLMADVDVAVLRPRWDVVMVDALASGGEQVVTIGTVYGGDKERGYLKFPNAIFMLTETAALKRAAPDFRPRTKRNNPKRVARFRPSTSAEVEIYGVPVGTVVKYDTGWQMPGNFKKHGYRGVCFTWRRWEGRYIIFDYQGRPIVTHLTNSTKWGPEHRHYLNWKRKIDVELRRAGVNI